MIPQKDRIEAAIRHIQTSVDIDPWAMELAVNALKAQLPSAQSEPQPTCNNLTTDCISRKAAIDAIDDYLDEYSGLDEEGYHGEKWCAMAEAKMVIENLQSAQPKSEERTAESAQNVPNDELISKKAAIEAVQHAFDRETLLNSFVRKVAVDALKTMPPAQPEPHYDEWCTDCKEYDHERHCCPRWNRVIRETLKDAQPNTDHIYAELSKVYNVKGLPDEAIGIIGDLMLSLDEPSAQPERLTDDDFETIRIHLNAYKEKLCNQQRWKEAEEYQRIIDRFMTFASAHPNLQPTCNELATDTISRQAAIDAIDKLSDEPIGYLEAAIDALADLPSAQPEPMSDAYMKAVWTWLLDYQIKVAELKGRYTPYEVLSWVANDWRKEHEQRSNQQTCGD